jgi:uncharacterized lipoprotein YajG
MDFGQVPVAHICNPSYWEAEIRIVFLVALGFELKASFVLGSCSTTWATLFRSQPQANSSQDPIPSLTPKIDK